MSNDNMLSIQTTVFNTELKNKGFVLLDEIFKKHGWHMTKNEVNWISYTKFGNETDLFDIKINQKSIHVSIPIKNSPFQFVTSFSDYYRATEYIETRFFDFISEKN
jgi:hypothetical protein